MIHWLIVRYGQGNDNYSINWGRTHNKWRNVIFLKKSTKLWLCDFIVSIKYNEKSIVNGFLVERKTTTTGIDLMNKKKTRVY